MKDATFKALRALAVAGLIVLAYFGVIAFLLLAGNLP
tara:strand:- start:1281 stop:1391 length:111 start_codon:yes stop_codon:yes gene_type:complete